MRPSIYGTGTLHSVQNDDSLKTIGRPKLGSLADRLYPCLLFRRPPEADNTFEGTCFHAAEAEAAACGHFVVLVADVDEKGTCLLGPANLALFAQGFVEPKPPEASMSGKCPVG